MSQSELLTKVIEVLDAAEVPYLLTGSYASSLQGEPRLTHDIDLLVAITPLGARFLVRAFPGPDYYLDEGAIIEAISHRSQFNLLDAASGDKVDFWILTNEPFDQSRFSRRYSEKFLGREIFFSQPEDTILMKLKWCEMSGGSEKQFADARSVYELQHAALDLAYLEKWAKILTLDSLWTRLKNEADPI
jgi:hypothetical protein